MLDADLLASFTDQRDVRLTYGGLGGGCAMPNATCKVLGDEKSVSVLKRRVRSMFSRRYLCSSQIENERGESKVPFAFCKCQVLASIRFVSHLA
jgi:hypothetical protein